MMQFNPCFIIIDVTFNREYVQQQPISKNMKLMERYLCTKKLRISTAVYIIEQDIVGRTK